jgi:serine/threonine-protein kinase RsbW
LNFAEHFLLSMYAAAEPPAPFLFRRTAPAYSSKAQEQQIQEVMVILSSVYREFALQDQANFSITLSIDSRLEQIRLVRAAMSGVLAHLGVVESDVYDLELAATEIINNSLEHGYQGATDKQVEVHLEVSGAEVRIDLSDSGPPFPEAEMYRLQGEPAPLEDASEDWPMRGHGLQIVRQIVDSIALHSEPGGNRITLLKHVRLRE